MKSNVMTPKFRVSYPSVFRPSVHKDAPAGTEPKYSVTALFPKGTDLTPLKKAYLEEGTKKWGPDTKKWPKFKNETFRRHEDFAKENDQGKTVLPMGMEEGGVMVRFTTKQRPGLIDAQNNDILSESEFYAGCWARCTVRAFAYDKAGQRGISFGLQNIQKVADGEPLSGRAKAQDEFAPIQVESADAIFG